MVVGEMARFAAADAGMLPGILPGSDWGTDPGPEPFTPVKPFDIVGGGEPVGKSIPFRAPEPTPDVLEDDVPTPVPAVLLDANIPLFLVDIFRGGGNPVGDAT